jgi:hypothetical protein
MDEPSPLGGLPLGVLVDALTCCGTCRTRKSRGADLAYLATMPPDQARARRMVHEADESAIAVEKMATAFRREGRQGRRGLPRVKHLGTASPRPPDGR